MGLEGASGGLVGVGVAALSAGFRAGGGTAADGSGSGCFGGVSVHGVRGAGRGARGSVLGVFPTLARLRPLVAISPVAVSGLGFHWRATARSWTRSGRPQKREPQPPGSSEGSKEVPRAPSCCGTRSP